MKLWEECKKILKKCKKNWEENSKWFEENCENITGKNGVIRNWCRYDEKILKNFSEIISVKLEKN